MDLNQAAVFAKVVSLGSFTAAAKQLGVQKSSVSRKVSELEERLGVRLLQRTTRKLNLTEEGRLYYQRCSRLLAELEETEQALSGRRAIPQGLLRVTMPLSFGFAAKGLVEFLHKQPKVQLEVMCTDRVVDVVEEGFDVALRAGTLADSALMARRVGSLPRYLVASPKYLARRGTPSSPAELDSHDCITFGAKLQATWALESGKDSVQLRVNARLAVNDLDLVREAAIGALGVALIPGRSCQEAFDKGLLRRVLPKWTAAHTPIHAVYPSSRHLSTKVKGFVEQMHKALGGEGL